MALRKPETTEETAVETETVVETEVVETTAPEVKTEAKPEPAEQVKQQAAPPVPRAAAAAPAVPGETPSFFRTNEVIQTTIDEASSGDFPQLVATGGTFKISGEKIDVGQELTFYALGTKQKWICSTGSSDEEAKEYYAAAYTGDLAKDGKTIDEWVEDSRAAGYSKAKKTEYLDVFVEVVSNSNTKFRDLKGEIMVLQLSFMSLKQWKSFASALRIKYSWGDMEFEKGSPLLKAVARGESNKAGQDYTIFTFFTV